MAPGIMHILFVHSDGFVIKEFNFRFPSIERERGSGGRSGAIGGVEDDSKWSGIITPSAVEQQTWKPKHTR